jgi:hypothetical protein
VFILFLTVVSLLCTRSVPKIGHKGMPDSTAEWVVGEKNAMVWKRRERPFHCAHPLLTLVLCRNFASVGLCCDCSLFTECSAQWESFESATECVVCFFWNFGVTLNSCVYVSVVHAVNEDTHWILFPPPLCGETSKKWWSFLAGLTLETGWFCGLFCYLPTFTLLCLQHLSQVSESCTKHTHTCIISSKALPLIG